VQVELLQLAGRNEVFCVWAVLEVLGICDGHHLRWNCQAGGVVVSVALVEVSLARTGAVGSARTIGVPADTITKFKASSSEFQTGFIFTFIN